MSWFCIPCIPKKRRPYPADSVGEVPSNAPTPIASPESIPGQLPSQSHIPNNHNGTHHDYGHRQSHTGSQTPSLLQALSFPQSAGPAPMEQGHNSHPHRYSYSSDQQHHHRPQSSRRSSRSHNGNGNYGMPHAPPLHIPHNSEPVGAYASDPWAGADHQPQYASQSAYGHSPTAADPSVPMRGASPAPSGGPYGTTSPQYHDATYEPHENTRALPVPQYSRSRRQPLVSQGMDAPDPMLHDSRTHHPDFRHSRCTGNRKALCVGINYIGQKNSLQGCVDDAQNIYEFLMEHNYPHSNIIVLTDDNPEPHSQPTRSNLLDAMRWLVADAQADDALFFHYSGHGGRTRDMDGDEVDGYDEVIFPVDYQKAGIITDDVLHDMLVKSLPAGCRLTAVFDSCHSGSVLDLVFEFHSNGKLKSGPVTRAFQQAKTSPADVVCFSGCKDSQTSADVVQGGVAVGAMSYAFLKVLRRNPQITYIDLLRGVREILKKKYSQKPQLSATHKVDKNLQFIM